MMNRPEFHGPNLENHPHYDPAPVPGASAWAIGVIGLGGGVRKLNGQSEASHFATAAIANSAVEAA